MTRLDGVAWPDIPQAALLLIPFGSTEQHGPHLPFTVDAVIAEAVATAAGTRLGAVVAPPLPYGSSGEHQGFPGTLSIGREALRTIVVELVRSARTWAERVVLVNGHGGNVPVLAQIVPFMRAEGHAISWFGCVVPHADSHAGRTETSLMLHLDAERVGDPEGVQGNAVPIGQLMERLRAGELRKLAPSGVLGDPRGASAAEGRSLLQDLVDEAVDRIRGDRVGPHGELRAVE